MHRHFFSSLTILLSFCAPMLSAPEARANSSVFIVGDSVLSALTPRDTNAAQSIIGGGNWQVDINAKACRRATTQGCMKGGKPESVLEVLQSRSNKKSTAVVLMIGHNDERNATFLRKVQTILNDLADSPQVFWINMREISESYKRANQMISAEAEARKNVRVIDWNKESKAQSEWVSSDGVHLKTAGAKALARLILKDLNHWKPAHPSTAADSSTSPGPKKIPQKN